MKNQKNKTLVMKFGGTSVQTTECFAKIAELVIERSKIYSRIAIVVSAMGDMTDHLIEMAYKVNPNPPNREYDMLVSVGERISISLLAMALEAKGRKAVSFTGSQSGIITTDHHREATIVDVRPLRLLNPLEKGHFVIVAGFQGVSPSGEITTLGRGGSDTTAVALGIALRAEKVEFFKDVPGIFNENPKINSDAQPYSLLHYQEALDVVMRTGGQVLHPRSIKLAQKNSLQLHILSFEENCSNDYLSIKGTIIRNCEGLPLNDAIEYE